MDGFLEWNQYYFWLVSNAFVWVMFVILVGFGAFSSVEVFRTLKLEKGLSKAMLLSPLIIIGLILWFYYGVPWVSQIVVYVTISPIYIVDWITPDSFGEWPNHFIVFIVNAYVSLLVLTMAIYAGFAGIMKFKALGNR